jgi:hypothetical protein
MHGIIFAQAGPVEGGTELAKIATSGGPMLLLSVAVVGLLYAIHSLYAEIKALNGQLVAGEKEHSKAVAEVLKDSSKTLQDIRDMLRVGGAPK